MPTNAQDQAFITSTAQDNLSEITDGRLAESQSGNLAVALYGRQLVADHSFVTQETYAAALQSGTSVATAPSATQAAQTMQLQQLSGAAFDQQYLANEAQGNAMSVTDGMTESASGQNAAVEQFNGLLVPFQSQHLLQAQFLQAETGGTPPAAMPPVPLSGGLALAPNGPLNAQDANFIAQASSLDATEVQAGNLAQTQAASADAAVTTYGRWLVLDHTVLNTSLMSFAQAEGVTPTNTPTAGETATLGALSTYTGSTFNSAYLQADVNDQTFGIQAFVHEEYNGADPALVAFAQSAVPLLEQHLAAAVQANLVLTSGNNDLTGAPTTAIGQLAAAVGNYTAQGVVAIAQETTSPGSSGFGGFSTGVSLFPAIPGSGTTNLGSLTGIRPTTSLL